MNDKDREAFEACWALERNGFLKGELHSPSLKAGFRRGLKHRDAELQAEREKSAQWLTAYQSEKSAAEFLQRRLDDEREKVQKLCEAWREFAASVGTATPDPHSELVMSHVAFDKMDALAARIAEQEAKL